MRLVASLLVGAVFLGIYAVVVSNSVISDYIDPGSVSPSKLGQLVPEDTIPSGFVLEEAKHGIERWHPDSIEVALWQGVYRHGEDKIGIEFIVTGSRWARVGLRNAHDALCYGGFDEGCDPQFNLHRYESLPPSGAGEKSVSGQRGTGEVKTRSATFVRAGVIVTVTIQSGDPSVIALTDEISQSLDRSLTEFAREKGVRVEPMAKH